MVILHIARLTNDNCSGVNVAVPQHIIAQQEIETIGFLNITNVHVNGINNQLLYNSVFTLDELAAPFNNPDLIVFHEVYYPEFLKIYKKIENRKIPYVIVPHGCLTRQAQRKKYAKKLMANLLVFNKFIYNARAVQFLSENEKENSYFKVNKVIGTNGINLPCDISQIRKDDKKRLVYIGALFIHIKGIDLMLKAIQVKKDLFKQNNVEIHLYGPDIEQSHQKVKKMILDLEIDEIVELHDAVYGIQKQAVLQETDVFIQTSRTEGMSMGLLEALSYGIPCLVTKGTNLDKKIVEYGAGWGAETNVEAISESLEKMIVDQALWETKSKNAKKMVEREFLWEVVSEEIIRIYKELCRDNEV